MTFTPKKDFQSDAARRRWWTDATDNVHFAAALSAAFCEMQQQLQPPPDLATAASYAYRIEGAKQFARILATLSEVPKVQTQPERRDNLSHSA